MEAQEEIHLKKGLTQLEESLLFAKLSLELKLHKAVMQKIGDIFKKYAKGNWFMDFPLFSEFLYISFGFTDKFFMDRIFMAADADKNKRIDLEEFLRIVVILLYGTVDEKIQLCFKCYDLSDNNELTREDITALLLEALNEPPTKNNNAEFLSDLLDVVFSKMDIDGDGVISYDEFKSICYEDWLNMQSFGQILPDHIHRAAFLVLLETEQEME